MRDWLCPHLLIHKAWATVPLTYTEEPLTVSLSILVVQEQSGEASVVRRSSR